MCLRTGTDCHHAPTVTPCSAGHQLLLPLTQSLYVNGTIAQPDKVMIDIGTGYFVEVRKRWGRVQRVGLVNTFLMFLTAHSRAAAFSGGDSREEAHMQSWKRSAALSNSSLSFQCCLVQRPQGGQVSDIR